MLLEVAEGIQYQSSSEEISWKITTTEYGSDPSNVSVAVYEEGNSTAVTSTVMPVNSPSVDGDVITLSPLKSLTRGKTYRVEVLFDTGGNTTECYFRVKCII